MIRGAIVREETRGVHTRHDFPEAASSWRRHITWQRGIPEHREQAINGPSDDHTTLPLAARTTATA